MRFELYRARRGLFARNQWRWRLRAPNGRIVAHSGESYNNRGDALKAMELVRCSAEAPLVDGAGL